MSESALATETEFDYGGDGAPGVEERQNPEEKFISSEQIASSCPRGQSLRRLPNELERCEKEIRKHAEGIDAAYHAQRIRDEQLYEKKGYVSVTTYIREELPIQKTQWYNLLGCAEVRDVLDERWCQVREHLSTGVETVVLPRRVNWTIPLQPHTDDPKLLCRLWAAVLDRLDDPTQEKMRDIVEELTGGDQEEPDADRSNGGAESRSSTASEKRESEEKKLGGEESADGGDEVKASHEASDSGGPTSRAGGDHSSSGGSPKEPTADSGEASDDGSDESDLGSEPELEGAWVEVSSEAASTVGAASSSEEERVVLDWEELSRNDLRELAAKSETSEKPLGKSSSEEGIASSTWRPASSSRCSFDGGLPTDKKFETAILKPQKIGRLSFPRVEARADQVLVCPGHDLFASVVPDAFVEIVLEDIEDVGVDPVLFTHCLERGADFSLPEDAWVGARASRETLSETARALGKLESPGVRWVLYDIQEKDRLKGPPDLPDVIDWIVYDPPGGAGISLDISEIKNLTEGLEVEWAFRRSFKAFGKNVPAR